MRLYIFCLLLFFLFLPVVFSYSSLVVVNSHRVYFDRDVDRVVYLEVLKFVPVDCNVRVDVVSRNNVVYDGYAWYSGRITIYDGNNLDYKRKVYVLNHEIGHVCAENNRRGTYEDREDNADKYAMELMNYDW